MRKGIMSISVFFLILMLCVPSYAESYKESDRGYQEKALLDVGMTQTFLDFRTDEEINELYSLIQENEIRYEEKIEHMNSGESISLFETIPRDHMTLRVSTVNVLGENVGGRNRIRSIVVYVDYAWNSGYPVITKTDGITVNWSSSLFYMEPDSFRSADYHHYGTGNPIKITINQQVDPQKLNQGGLGYEAVLTPRQGFEDMLCVVTGSASFVLESKSDIYFDQNRNTKSDTINVEYVHDKNVLPFPISFSYNGAGVSINTGMLQARVAVNKVVRYSV